MPRILIYTERNLIENKCLTEEELIILAMDWRHFQENNCFDWHNHLSFLRLSTINKEVAKFISKEVAKFISKEVAKFVTIKYNFV
jgi:hypothetical protein